MAVAEQSIVSLNLNIVKRPVPIPIARTTTFAFAARTREVLPVNTDSAPLDMQTWHLPTPVELQEAETLRNSYRRQPNEYYDNRQAPTDCQPFIVDATAGDTHVDTAQFGIIHRFHIDTLKANHHRLDDTVIANIRYVLQQAGTPSDDANRLARHRAR